MKTSNMYSQDGALVLKNGVVLPPVEIVDLLNKLQKVNDKWYALEEKVAKYYEQPDYGYEDDWEYDEEEGNLCDIGQDCAIAFGYL